MIALGSETAIADLIAAATDSPIFSPMIDACVDISLVSLASLRLAVMAVDCLSDRIGVDGVSDSVGCGFAYVLAQLVKRL
jgi:hypothetical protein